MKLSHHQTAASECADLPFCILLLTALSIFGLTASLAFHLDCTLDPDAPNDPRYSGCESCGKTWNRVRSHTTDYGDGGCFPLCVDCWEKYTPEQRLPFYRSMWEKWIAEREANHGTYDITDWDVIRKAVLSEGPST